MTGQGNEADGLMRPADDLLVTGLVTAMTAPGQRGDARPFVTVCHARALNRGRFWSVDGQDRLHPRDSLNRGVQ